ncbi:hypothetical protein EUGRSUZ_B02128 [Eucalyptus grandis]|uniref:Uncharacterized protein n=2 Tax=Eucalyptus grandis TaxID=71139 RepID=A0ACC3LTB7_EUCGR|nr:hypothetical protein EUGRSUZ_B02128 [Eucalyptus grandis]
MLTVDIHRTKNRGGREREIQQGMMQYKEVREFLSSPSLHALHSLFFFWVNLHALIRNTNPYIVLVGSWLAGCQDPWRRNRWESHGRRIASARDTGPGTDFNGCI